MDGLISRLSKNFHTLHETQKPVCNLLIENTDWD